MHQISFDGVYAELREGAKLRDRLITQLMTVEGRIQNHIQRYFPEFFDVFKDWKGKAAFCTLCLFPFHCHKAPLAKVFQKAYNK